MRDMSTFYVGVDIATNENYATVVNEKFKVLKSFKFLNNTSGFAEFRKQVLSITNKENLRIGFEASDSFTEGFLAYITKGKYLYYIITPEKVSLYRQSKDGHINKTDKEDSRMIAEWLQNNENTLKYKNTIDIRSKDLKTLIHFHTTLTKDHESKIRALKSYVGQLFSGIYVHNTNFIKLAVGRHFVVNYLMKNRLEELTESKYAEFKEVSRSRYKKERFLELVEAVKNNECKEYITEEALDRIRYLQNTIDNIDKELAHLDSKLRAYTRQVNPNYRQIKGIGALLTITLEGAIPEIQKFSNVDKFISYCGFNLSVNQTGMQVPKVRTSRMGSRYIKAAIYSALPSIKRDNPEIMELIRNL